MIECKFHIIWPGGNTTAIVEGHPTLMTSSALSHIIMNRFPDIEQVGFMEHSGDSRFPFRLHMMGGEFCGNAARSCAFLYSQTTGHKTFSFMVSGFNSPVSARVTTEHVSITLPGHFAIKQESKYGHTVVDPAGIRHIVVFGNRGIMPPQKLIDRYDQPHLPAIGIMYVSKNQEMRLNPVVYVRDMNKIVQETACGSGSIAVALACRQLGSHEERFVIQQPSDVPFTVDMTTKEKTLQKITLGGRVVYQGLKVLHPWGLFPERLHAHI